MTIKNVRKAIFDLLKDDSAVSSIVGTRVYPIILPQGETSPSVVYHIISEDTDYNMDGPSGLVQTRMQLDAVALTQTGAFDLADVVKNVLSGFSGSVSVGTSSPPEEIVIRGVFHINGRDIYDSIAKLYLSQRDYMIWYMDQ